MFTRRGAVAYRANFFGAVWNFSLQNYNAVCNSMLHWELQHCFDVSFRNMYHFSGLGFNCLGGLWDFSFENYNNVALGFIQQF